MHNYIAYISGGKSHALLDAHNALQSIADKVDLFVHSGEGFSVLLALYVITFFVMLAMLMKANDAAELWPDEAGMMVDGLNHESFIEYIKEKGYVRNKHGVMQRIDDWMENGSRKPKPRRTMAQKIKDVGDHFIDETAKIKEKMGGPSAEYKTEAVERKPLTRAEACLAILHEAKDAGFEWAQSAIEQFDAGFANSDCDVSFEGLQRAIDEFADYEKTREGWDYWDGVFHSPEVQSFNPKTQWPA